MSGRFQQTLKHHNLSLHREVPQVLQINVGKRCNQTCAHCHVNAGPARMEIMTRHTMDRVLDWLAGTTIPTVDITGGAPELNPDFRYLVQQIKALTPRRHVMDRCNLTVLFELGQEDLADFLAHHGVEIIASLPCYSMENVDAQRGDGVFEKSIKALQLLNRIGYGSDPRLLLQLVYNPLGAYLPGPQAELEAQYKTELMERFGIVFNRLYTITNMPIARFAGSLRRSGEAAGYQELLVEAFNPQAVPNVMCRTTINIGWRGEVYDCDFNQMLGLAWQNGRQYSVWDLDLSKITDRPIVTGDHCFGCTAGAGSSCGGAIL